MEKRAASRIGTRSLGFQPDARLDDGEMWPVAYALTSLTAADEKRIAALVARAHRWRCGESGQRLTGAAADVGRSVGSMLSPIVRYRSSSWA